MRYLENNLKNQIKHQKPELGVQTNISSTLNTEKD